MNNDTYIVEYLAKDNKWRAYNKTAGLWSAGWANTYSTKQSAVNAARRKANKGDWIGVYKKDGTRHYQEQI